MRTRLDKKLLAKLITKTGKPEKYLREQISKKANKLGISSEASLVIFAKQVGISTNLYRRRLPPHIQEESRNQINKEYSKPILVKKIVRETKTKQSVGNGIIGSIERIISDTISKIVIAILKPSSSSI